jgi:hypothetical protein
MLFVVACGTPPCGPQPTPGIIEHPEPTLTADVRIIRTDHAEGDHGIRIEGFPDGARHLGRMRENGKNLLWLVSCSLQGGVPLIQLHQGLDYRLYDSSFPDRERFPVDVDGGVLELARSLSHKKTEGG